jgi:hypothetical protein
MYGALTACQAQVEAQHARRRARVKRLTDRGAAQMMFHNECAARPLRCLGVSHRRKAARCQRAVSAVNLAPRWHVLRVCASSSSEA